MNLRWTLRRLNRWGISRRKLRGGRLHGLLGDRFLHRDLWIPSRESLARAWLIGMTVTSIPFLPLQSVIACGIGFFLGANLPVCLLLQYLSNPATAFIQVPACFFVGRLLMGDHPAALLSQIHHGPMALMTSDNLIAIYLGAIVIGPILGVIGYFLTHLIWRERPAGGKRGTTQA
ncbi:hypothetical protein GALL_114040 [mine drainage metagenome]|uniref:DUF2062 domain-containing protein n=1 Tax=mine drainage metagenome TaxID=410659 RepID=A0A1J5SDL0_9ZZZZ